ncbi:MAG TPA: ABC transporter permease [Thermoleophilaceae bacterium]
MSTSAAAAYRVAGPRAISGDWSRFWHLTLTLAYTDWKLRFFGSVLGYVWSLLRPLMLFGILYFVFSLIVRIGDRVEHYPLVLLVGIVLFSYFGEVTSDCVQCVVDREQLVRKVTFPRMVVPLSVALSGSFSLVLNLVAVAVFVGASGVDPRLTWLLLPIPLLLLVALAAGVGMLVSALYVPFRDVRPIWDVVLQGLFYATPIFFPIQFVIGQGHVLTKLVLLNPLAVIIVDSRHYLLGPEAPSAATAAGSDLWLVLPAAVLVAAVAVGFGVFNRLAPRVAEDL